MNCLKNIFIFLGPPGAGKGSLSQECITKLGWKQLSTGALCRKHILDNTEIGQKIDFAIKSGKLIDDELIVAMVQEWLAGNMALFDALILDGFPRTIVQAKALHKLFSKNHDIYKLNIVKLFISNDSLIKRLTTRLICANSDCQLIYSEECKVLAPKKPLQCDTCKSSLTKRADDKLEAIEDRLKTYHMHEKGLIDFYTHHGFKVNQVNVEKPLHEVFEDFQMLINTI